MQIVAVATYVINFSAKCSYRMLHADQCLDPTSSLLAGLEVRYAAAETGPPQLVLMSNISLAYM